MAKINTIKEPQQTVDIERIVQLEILVSSLRNELNLLRNELQTLKTQMQLSNNSGKTGITLENGQITKWVSPQKDDSYSSWLGDIQCNSILDLI